MRVLHVWDYEYPWDVRVEKISSALVGAGHSVHLVARNRTRDRPFEELPEGSVHRLPPWTLLPARLDGALQFPAFFNPRWLHHVARTARRHACELLLVRDLPLSPTALRVGRKLGLPVVLDMAENYPAMMRDLWHHGRARPLDHLVRNPGVVARVERHVVARVDHILVVVEEARDRLVRLGVPTDRISVVSNTPPLGRVGVREEDAKGEVGALRLCYLGLMELPRGIQVVLEGVRRLRERAVPFHLDLIGSGRDLELFRRRASGLGLGPEDVTFHGFLPYRDGLEIVERAHVGLVPHLPGEFWDTTVPNKLFDYMAAGLPVLAADARPVARIVGETACGVVYPGEDPEAFAAAAESLRDPGRRAAVGAAGRNAVLHRFHWENDRARLLVALERALRTFARSTTA